MIYAINKATKEHKITEPASVWDADKWYLVAATSDGWIEWGGGNPPLPREHMVEVRIVGGEYTKGQSCEMPWSSCSPVYRVTAYRPILEPQEQVKEWDGKDLPPIKTECEYWYPEGKEFRKGLCVAHHKGMAVMIDDKGDGAQLASIVKAIRTERDLWIESAMQAASCPDTATLIRSYFEAIYDAGLANTSED